MLVKPQSRPLRFLGSLSSPRWGSFCILALALVSLLTGYLIAQHQCSKETTKALVSTLRQANSHNAVDPNVIQELYHAVRTERLERIAKQYQQQYAKAQPFPHIAIDSIFPERFLQQVLLENPESSIVDGCLFGNAKTKSSACFQGGPNQNKKSYIHEEDLMGMHTRILFGVLKSSPFVKFLEQITGISSILPDPHYRGSGLHFTASGGNLNIHADFNKYQQGYNLDRRINSFIFLNDDWKEEYGGHLELWSRDMKECHQKILPTLGRFVIFSSTDFSYHGHPTPLPCPAHRARRSMALYYYTNGRPKHECLDNDCSGKGHSTLFQTPVGCQVCEETTCFNVDSSLKVPEWVSP